jgi:hypothetical protein
MYGNLTIEHDTYKIDRSLEVDTFGFPTDFYIVNQIFAYTNTTLRNVILVTPSGTGKTAAFKNESGKFIDEEAIMKLKWPMSDRAFKDKEATNLWMSVCTNVLIRAFKLGLPVAMSYHMFSRVSHRVNANETFIIFCVESEDVMKSRLASREVSRGDDAFNGMVKYKREVAVMSAHFCHYVMNELYDARSIEVIPPDWVLPHWSSLYFRKLTQISMSSVRITDSEIDRSSDEYIAFNLLDPAISTVFDFEGKMDEIKHSGDLYNRVTVTNYEGIRYPRANRDFFVLTYANWIYFLINRASTSQLQF